MLLGLHRDIFFHVCKIRGDDLVAWEQSGEDGYTAIFCNAAAEDAALHCSVVLDYIHILALSVCQDCICRHPEHREIGLALEAHGDHTTGSQTAVCIFKHSPDILGAGSGLDFVVAEGYPAFAFNLSACGGYEGEFGLFLQFICTAEEGEDIFFTKGLSFLSPIVWPMLPSALW